MSIYISDIETFKEYVRQEDFTEVSQLENMTDVMLYEGDLTSNTDIYKLAKHCESKFEKRLNI